MPIKRRRTKIRREPPAPGVEFYLRTGCYVDRVGGAPWFEAFQLAGQVMRCAARGGGLADGMRDLCEEITSTHIAESPGTRPHCWWAGAAPAPRDCGGLPPALIVPPFLWRLHFGRPFEFYTIPVGTVLHLESEAHFLRRHQLLEPDERRRIVLAAFEPEEIVVGDQSDITGATPTEEEEE
jgi:hypothetical protein